MRYTLPPDAAAFTGREEELNVISASVRRAPKVGRVVAIHAIDGMPGVGKTTLAVHAAHLLRDRFPDRQLLVNLHAHTPGQDPLTPEAALAGLLTAVGIDARNLPRDLQAGPAYGGTGWSGSGPSWSWTTPLAAIRSPRCCLGARAAWYWSPAAVTWAICPERHRRSCCRFCRR